MLGTNLCVTMSVNYKPLYNKGVLDANLCVIMSVKYKPMSVNMSLYVVMSVKYEPICNDEC